MLLLLFSFFCYCSCCLFFINVGIFQTRSKRIVEANARYPNDLTTKTIYIYIYNNSFASQRGLLNIQTQIHIHTDTSAELKSLIHIRVQSQLYSYINVTKILFIHSVLFALAAWCFCYYCHSSVKSLRSLFLLLWLLLSCCVFLFLCKQI